MLNRFNLLSAGLSVVLALSPVCVLAQTTSYDYNTVATSTNTNNNVQSGTVTNNNNNVNASTSTATTTNSNTNVNIQSGSMTNVTTATNNNIQSGTLTNNNNNNTVSASTSVDTSTSSQNITQAVTQATNNLNTNNSNSTSYSASTATQYIDQTVHSPPPSAIAPSIMSYSQDVCTSAVSGAVQTQIVGISAGKPIRDQNCERMKLSKTLYDMGMKVAAVSLLCQDARVFTAMEMAGTPCPYKGKIGDEAKLAWEQNPKDRPAK